MAPATVAVCNVNETPLHTGLLLVAEGVAGGLGSVKVNVSGDEGQPLSTTVTLV